MQTNNILAAVPPRPPITEQEIELLDHTFSYHAPLPQDLQCYEALRSSGKVLARVILQLCPPSADRAAAIRLVRQAVMTANAAIALGGRNV